MTRLTAVPDPDTAAAAGSKTFDCVLLVGHDLASAGPAPLRDALRAAMKADRTFESRPGLWPTDAAAGGRLVTAPTGPLLRDHDDVRRYADAAAAGMRRARDAGAQRVLLCVQPAPDDPRYAQAALVAAQAALGALWQPLEAREALGEKAVEPVQHVGMAALDGSFGKTDAAFVAAVDEGLRLCKDLCGTEPERMAPQRFAEYVQAAMKGTGVEVSVVSAPAVLKKEYPLLMAVARASMAVPRHRPCVVRLQYTGGTPRRTVLLAGKGVTYDTGGADLKVGGHMAGMSRDKGGAAAVAGLLLAAAKLKLKGVRLVAELGMVRNSIGADAYVADEIIESHAGARVRVGNTDAEGRMVLADLLSHLRVRALREKAPHLLTVATLTGHAGRAVGPYNIALDNGPARVQRCAERLQLHGELCADPFEVSRLRREDWDFVRPRTQADDVLQCNNAPSSQTERGHQFPMAFLCIAAGLAAHGGDSDKPLAFTHVDIGGSGAEGGDWQHGSPSGRPVVAMLRALAMNPDE